MAKKFLLYLTTFIFAGSVLFVSVLRSARPEYAFYQTPLVNDYPFIKSEPEVSIDYALPYPGSILPDNPLWFIKVARDRVWRFLTFDTLKKAEVGLLFANKRLGSSKTLFEKGKFDLGFSTLTKAEKYLEEAMNLAEKAQKQGRDTITFLLTISKASLKHIEEIENLVVIAPEDAKPEMIKIEDYSKGVYKKSRDSLLDKGITPPSDPFGVR